MKYSMQKLKNEQNKLNVLILYSKSCINVFFFQVLNHKISRSKSRNKNDLLIIKWHYIDFHKFWYFLKRTAFVFEFIMYYLITLNIHCLFEEIMSSNHLKLSRYFEINFQVVFHFKELEKVSSEMHFERSCMSLCSYSNDLDPRRRKTRCPSDAETWKTDKTTAESEQIQRQRKERDQPSEKTMSLLSESRKSMAWKQKEKKREETLRIKSRQFYRSCLRYEQTAERDVLHQICSSMFLKDDL